MGYSKGRRAGLWALAAVAIAGASVPQPMATAAQAAKASACKRFGDRPAYELRDRPARRAIVCFINRERRARGLRIVRRNHKLQRAAQRHNRRMVKRGCFAHQCPNEGSLSTRLRRADYLHAGLSMWAYGENLIWSELWMTKPRNMVRAWMGSPDHRANILNPNFREIGVGSHDGSPYDRRSQAATFTTDFGLRRD